MERKLVLGLVVVALLFSMIVVQPAKAEEIDTVEIYQSSTPDSRIDVDSLGVVNWNIRWLGNQTEIVNDSIIIIRVIGTDVDKLLCANYWLDGWRTEYVSFEVKQLEFSVFSVDCSGITEFEQTAENVTIIWDRIVIHDGTGITEIVIPTSPNLRDYVEVLGLLGGIIGICALFAIIVYTLIKGETRNG